eukprot:4843041-Alexandrium_andersonii.AAC.1
MFLVFNLFNFLLALLRPVTLGSTALSCSASTGDKDASHVARSIAGVAPSSACRMLSAPLRSTPRPCLGSHSGVANLAFPIDDQHDESASANEENAPRPGAPKGADTNFEVS